MTEPSTGQWLPLICDIRANRPVTPNPKGCGSMANSAAGSCLHIVKLRASEIPWESRDPKEESRI